MSHIPTKDERQPVKEGRHLHGDLSMLDPDSECLGQGAGPEGEQPYQHPRKCASLHCPECCVAVVLKAGGIIPRREDGDANDGLPQQLDNEVRRNENDPRVHFRVALPRLK